LQESRSPDGLAGTEASQNEGRQQGEAGLARFNVRCRTCKVTRAFLTPQGANSFILEHAGHEVVDGRYDSMAGVISEEFLHSGPQKPQPEGKREPAREEAAAPEVIEEPEPSHEVVRVETRIEATAPEMKQPAVLSEKDLREPLLLARSSYIEDSDERRMEALVVSRALKEFRWNVEPPYVIGILMDDNLSVETNIGVISSSMVRRVEELGYTFVAVNTPQGSPVAWFKRGGVDVSVLTQSPQPQGTMHLKQGKRTYGKDKAVKEESFLSLLMTVRDMDSERLKSVADTLRAAAKTEPDIQS